MRPRAYSAAAGIAAALLLHPVGAFTDDAQKAPPKLEGRYLVEGKVNETVILKPLGGGAYRVLGGQWEGVGLFDGTTYWGVFRYGPKSSPSDLAGANGTHRATRRADGSLAVRGEFTSGRSGSFEALWRFEGKVDSPGLGETPVRPREEPPRPDGLPQLDEYVYVEELPEAVTKVLPEYTGIDGTVLVQALVGQDGLIKDARVVKSFPGLDKAAVECVRRWVFKPALTKGKPVAVWVAVPVRFSRP